MTRAGVGALADPATLLASWDSAAAAPPLARGAVVLQAAGLCPEQGALDLPLGELGRLAAHCLSATFGDSMECVLTCPACGCSMELDLPIELTADRDGSPPGSARSGAELGDAEFTIRAPSTRDLLAATGQADVRGVLVRLCASGPEGDPVEVDQLSTEQRRRLEDGLERLAGTALPALNTTCPDCGADVEGVVDPADLLWTQVDRTAPALLRDVAALAAAFGWTERDILAMPASRRSAYLELARA